MLTPKTETQMTKNTMPTIGFMVSEYAMIPFLSILRRYYIAHNTHNGL